MPLQYHPKAGAVLVCDFSRGFVSPEMVKRRPVIVVSPPISVRQGLCTVVPISTEVPRLRMPYHVELSALTLPAPFDAGPNWAKCDMLYAVAFERLDLFRTRSAEDSKRRYVEVHLAAADLLRIRKGVLCSLGLAGLTKHLDSII